MICFEVSLNGDMICTAGVHDGLLVLDLFHHQIGGNAEGCLQVRGTTSKPAASDLAPRLQAALQHPERRNTLNQMTWGDRSVQVGDEITVRIVERTECDAPK
jgi:hypothetical protein